MAHHPWERTTNTTSVLNPVLESRCNTHSLKTTSSERLTFLIMSPYVEQMFSVVVVTKIHSSLYSCSFLDFFQQYSKLCTSSSETGWEQHSEKAVL